MKHYFLSLIVATLFIFCNSANHKQNFSTESIFTTWYYGNIAKDIESVSGGGSNLQATKTIRQQLSIIFKGLGIRSLLDAPCGDLNWIKEIDLSFLDYYIGVDIVQPLIIQNQIVHNTKNKTFLHLNIIYDPLPCADLILCRDCLVHLKNYEIFAALHNFKQSGARYLFTTTFPNKHNSDLQHTGHWRPINLQEHPFNFPEPLLIINEQCPNEGFHDKSLALWALKDIVLAKT